MKHLFVVTSGRTMIWLAMCLKIWVNQNNTYNYIMHCLYKFHFDFKVMVKKLASNTVNQSFTNTSYRWLSIAHASWYNKQANKFVMKYIYITSFSIRTRTMFARKEFSHLPKVNGTSRRQNNTLGSLSLNGALCMNGLHITELAKISYGNTAPTSNHSLFQWL